MKIYRFYEIIPGIIIWTIFLGLIILSFIRPLWAIYFIIAFYFYWLFKTIYFLLFLIIAWKNFRDELKTDWKKLVQTMSDWQKINHLVILATYKEPLGLIDSTFRTLVSSDYPLNKFIVVLAGEEKDKYHFQEIAQLIKKKYAHNFFKFITTCHPKNLKGEMAGKGSNIHFAGQAARRYLDQLNFKYENIITSIFDIDTHVHPKYFSCLTYKYLTNPNPTRCSFQPFPLFNNNIWQALAISRVIAKGTTFWLMAELAKGKSYFTFSSHSLSFKALADVGFWEPDLVSEDSRIFLQCYNYYNGDYKTVPLFVPISMDTVLSGNFKKTLINQYKQMRRWGYGIENVPYMIWHFWRNKKISWWKKLKPFWNQFESSCSWAISPIIIFIIGFLPLKIANLRLSNKTIVQNTPFVLESLMLFAMTGLIVSAIFSLILMPPKPKKFSTYKYLFLVLQWLLFPLTTIFFGAIPATEAITRLMLGKYLGFNVTEKTT